jgi:5-amino-6-(5-phospho-D-ribitylamino)uracil phosphatase
MTLYVTDLDGTLLNSQSQISIQSLSLLKPLIHRGLNLVIATGRSAQTGIPYALQLGTKHPVILSNGAYTQHPITRSMHRLHALSMSTALETLTILDQYNLTPFIKVLDEHNREHFFHKPLSNSFMKEILASDFAQWDSDFIHEIDAYHHLQNYRVIHIQLADTDATLKEPRSFIEAKKQTSLYYMQAWKKPDHFWMEIGHLNATKGNAIMDLKADLGATRIVCFGDNLNDLSMADIATDLFAMENATPALKKLAHKVIGHHDSDAVAEWIVADFMNKTN